jgi:CheY-like chemotaxis protein
MKLPITQDQSSKGATKVLIVDDEPTSVMALAFTLEDEGFIVKTAGSGREAVERGRIFLPDVLVSDWKLGDELDGIDVAVALKNINGEMKIILCSGLGIDDMGPRAREVDISRVMEKPCGVEEIVRVIREIIATGRVPV